MLGIKQSVESRLIDIESQMYRLDQEAAQLRVSLEILSQYENEGGEKREEVHPKNKTKQRRVKRNTY